MMRAICLLLVSLFALKVNAQQYTKFNGYGFAADRMRSDSISIHPSDTVRNKAARSIAVLNGVFYIADGTKWKVVGTDTTSLSNRINLKLNIADTSSMLNPYLRKTDTVTLSNRINTKLNISDTASMLSSYSKLKSVGLTMPSAFSVANSPLTSDGTLAVSGAGTAAQYVRGDGQLANFPSNGGGGSSVNYYLNGSVNQGTFGGDTYYELSKIPIIGAGTNFTRTNAQGDGYIASFITDAGDPALLNIPGGNWNLEFYFNASSGGSTPSFYAEIYKVSSSNVFTLIASGSTNPEGITQGTVVDQYFTSIPVPQTTILATDRIAIRIFVTTSGRTITLHTEDNNLCEVLTTFSTGLNALNGLTSQVQYFATGTSGTDFNISSATDTHTFNIPSASTSARGLITTDAQTFAGAKTFNGGINLPNFIPINFTNGATVEGFNGKLVFRTVSGTAGYFENNSLYLAAMDNEPSTSNIGVMVKNFNSESKVGYKTPAQMMTYLGALGTTDTATMLNPYTRGSGTSGQVAYWNDTRSLTGSSGFTFTPTSSLLVNNSVTAASAIARGTNLTPTLTAAANNDVLVGLDVNPTFTNGAFTGVSNIGLRISNSSNIGVTLASRQIFNEGGVAAFYTTQNTRYTGVSLFNSSNTLGASFVYADNTVNETALRDAFIIGGRGASTKTILVGGPSANAYLTLFSTGNVTMQNGGTHTDAGFRLDVNGTARVQGNAQFGTGFYWDNANSRLGIGTSSPQNTFDVVRGTAGAMLRSQYESASFSFNADSKVGIYTASSNTAHGASLIFGQTNLQASSAYPSFEMQYVYSATVADNNWRLNYTGRNSSGLVTTFAANLFNVYADGRVILNPAASGVTASAKLLIGTSTDAGFRLDVNGTARVSSSSVTVATFSGTNASMRVAINNTTATPNVGFGLLANNVLKWSLASYGATSDFTFFNDALGLDALFIKGNTNNVIIGGTTDIPSAILQVTSTTKGFLPPRMTTAQRDLIATPAAGLVIFNTTLNQLSYYNGTTWINL